jgi:hypothetical protein
MAIIDSQVHVYDANTPKRPWHSVPNWPDHATGDETVTLARMFDAWGFDRCLWGTDWKRAFARATARRDRRRGGGRGWRPSQPRVGKGRAVV